MILRQTVVLRGLVVSGIMSGSHITLRGGLADPEVAFIGPCTREIVAARQSSATPLQVLRYMVIAVVRCKSNHRFFLLRPIVFPEILYESLMSIFRKVHRSTDTYTPF